MFTRFDTINECDRRTDRQTDRPMALQTALCVASCGKNRDFHPLSRFISEMIQDKAILTMLPFLAKRP